MLIMRGFPLTAFDDWTLGMVINYCHAYDRQQKRMNGEDVPDPDAQYRKMKAMQPQIEELHRKGQITETKYRSFTQSIENYEKLLEEG